ncbi:fused N-acetylglucosamine-1-phosphate uridyltransferase and glucosamine-1-phosphate acetyltransferase [Campylobacter pinnipediorum subsp. pinnipediorum]|uniref:bifunctional UDP-N-acetylglucosamine diphosphorylase/glucosamine-1-phosphate N-acetyltransferase GlmU n=1 Tax=Campylobacter pinnipediorum TaxID=1965231 RepID=UPI000994DD86|nr:bifunctional UDP-N-acetylglucosamine diphosphorylase/glucosamine-1-phosphate N-acetyltransferase GlmU [Campylobacter pinnipediorum]AQW81424.1 fused N-acetylglucosamine-1-phosphate uridyltransferase and glucosamine-1-phosphate acetyltransferase [Campylobacter pinnipediorum subsp. pinnipediorum]AQW84620.1 fused N-acetylglucosamine-1-phosphate uridyltransferase and glucosamine-1-phosphate acetyltransferase [Campylobacter pinnipediorum subsp. pinnipediorum]
MKETSIIILAAGLGTRMKSKTPKVMFEICGASMISHILNKAYKITDDVCVVLYHQKDMIQEHILKNYPDTKIHIQDFENFPGTAGALIGAISKTKKTIILCGDMPLITQNELENLAKSDLDLTISSFNTENPFGYGRIISENNQVLSIVEEKDASENEKKIKSVNAGCYAFKTDALEKILPLIKNNNAQNEYYLTDAVKIANELSLKCGIIEVKEQNFMGINDKFQLSIAEKIMQDEIKKDLMKSGVLMRMPNTTYIDCRAKFEGECVIEENVSIIGECLIKNSIVKSSSVIEYSEIQNSSIGPLARIRPKSKIKNTRIGNFVETKNANLDGVKAGHLSYLGDCEVQEGTNIGCGFITCNYDGKNKYQTKIGKNVFVGSDTQVIAPVTIQDDVMIAAGSTITKDIPSGALAVSRTKQINKDRFFYKFFKEEK